MFNVIDCQKKFAPVITDIKAVITSHSLALSLN